MEKKDTHRVLLRALSGSRDGLTFKEVREAIGASDTWVTKTLRALYHAGLVDYYWPTRRFRIAPSGGQHLFLWDLSRWLLTGGTIGTVTSKYWLIATDADKDDARAFLHGVSSNRRLGKAIGEITDILLARWIKCVYPDESTDGLERLLVDALDYRRKLLRYAGLRLGLKQPTSTTIGIESAAGWYWTLEEVEAIPSKTLARSRRQTREIIGLRRYLHQRGHRTRYETFAAKMSNFGTILLVPVTGFGGYENREIWLKQALRREQPDAGC